MITKFQNYKLITEDPDSIYGKGEDDDDAYIISDDDAMPFCMDIKRNKKEVEKIYFGPPSGYHANMTYQGKKRSYPGRIWTESKIMSFWVYPSEELFVDIIKTMEKELNIKMFNNGWRIEVLKTKKSGKIRRKTNGDLYFGGARLGNEEIIPIEEYAGSENVPEEQRIQHMMNWKEKEQAKKSGQLSIGNWGSAKTAWDQPHNIKYRQAIRTSESLIKESPDTLEDGDHVLSWYYTGTKAFFVEVNPDHTKVERLYVGNRAHCDICTDEDDDDYEGGEIQRSYAGRLWLDHKIMSFWVYPNVILFKQIIKELEDYLNIKIFKNGWRIEVRKTSQGIRRREIDSEDDDIDFYFGTRDKAGRNDRGEIEIISVDEYAGSENTPEKERIQHMMNWKEKEEARKAGKLPIGNWGSAKTAWDQPHNIKWRQALRNENNKNK